MGSRLPGGRLDDWNQIQEVAENGVSRAGGSGSCGS